VRWVRQWKIKGQGRTVMVLETVDDTLSVVKMVVVAATTVVVVNWVCTAVTTTVAVFVSVVDVDGGGR
jgi:hypothetical protein